MKTKIKQNTVLTRTTTFFILKHETLATKHTLDLTLCSSITKYNT